MMVKTSVKGGVGSCANVPNSVKRDWEGGQDWSGWMKCCTKCQTKTHDEVAFNHCRDNCTRKWDASKGKVSRALTGAKQTIGGVFN
jgi:hypothetical protein